MLRDAPEYVVKKLAVKNFDAKAIVDKVLELDAQRRSLQTESDSLLSQQKQKAGLIGGLMKEGKKAEAEEAKKEVAELKAKSSDLLAKADATEKELDNALLQGDMFAAMEFKDKIGTMMNVVATAYSCFRSEQLKVYDDNASIKETKDMLKQRLVELNDLLNRHMYKSITGQDKGDGIDLFYEEWKKSHQPFHGFRHQALCLS